MSHDEGLSDPGKEARLEQHLPVVPIFDGYRALAIFGIVVLHIMGSTVEPEPSALTLGSLAQFIDVLFIISGFVVFLPTVARQGNFGPVKGYAIRRIARLIPAYWLAPTICILLLWLWPPSIFLSAPAFDDILINFAGAQVGASFFTDVHVGFLIDEPVWTLSLEIAFDLILPFVASVYFRNPLKGLFAAFLIAANRRAIAAFQIVSFISLVLFVVLLGNATHDHTSQVAVGLGRISIPLSTGFTLSIPFSLALAPRWVQWPFANTGCESSETSVTARI